MPSDNLLVRRTAQDFFARVPQAAALGLTVTDLFTAYIDREAPALVLRAKGGGEAIISDPLVLDDAIAVLSAAATELRAAIDRQSKAAS